MTSSLFCLLEANIYKLFYSTLKKLLARSYNTSWKGIGNKQKEYHFEKLKKTELCSSLGAFLWYNWASERKKRLGERN